MLTRIFSGMQVQCKDDPELYTVRCAASFSSLISRSISVGASASKQGSVG